MDEERDIIVFTDENGEEVELEFLDYFTHEGEQYALLADIEECDCEHEDEECDCDECGEHSLYIVSVKTAEDGTEEFIPIPPEQEETLIAVVEAMLAEEEDEEDELEDEKE